MEYGEIASSYSKEMLLNQQVELEFDVYNLIYFAVKEDEFFI